MRKAASILLGLASTAVVVWELPALGKFILKILGIATTFDFFYERSRDPTWLGRVAEMALNPPPGTALLTVLVLAAFFYWKGKPREIRMSVPVIGLLLSVISFAGFGVWYLVRNQSVAVSEPPVTIPTLPVEISERLDRLERDKLTLTSELNSARQKLALATNQPAPVIPVDVEKHLAAISELEKNSAAFHTIKIDGEDLLKSIAVLKPDQISQTTNRLVRLRDRSTTAVVRQSQILGKYQLADIQSDIGNSPDVSMACNHLINMLSTVDGITDVQTDIIDQPAYQIFLEQLKQVGDWVDEKNARLKALRSEYEKARNNEK